MTQHSVRTLLLYCSWGAMTAWHPALASEVGAAPAARCLALPAMNFQSVPDAPAKVTTTEVVPSTATTPEHCKVQGYVRPNLRFELRMPLQSWNGKHLMRGCGGFCGNVLPRCDKALTRGYACIASDMGHYSTGTDAVWAWNNREAELDFTHRATHVTAVIGRAVTAAFYGQAPQRSYYDGCSTGGRQGLQSAQRFPEDFDGIVAGAPVVNETGAGMQLLWSILAARNQDGSPALEPRHARLLHRAALDQCDAEDGIANGVIDDPRSCQVDLARLRCAASSTQDCLTPDQMARVRRIYDGPRNSQGVALYTGGAMPGSELNWIGAYLAEPNEVAAYYHFIGDLFRHLGFAEDPGPAWRLEDFDFDRDPARLGFMEQMFTASNPDLRRFKARGGKLLIYQGWADQSVVPLNVIDYFELATRTMGGARAMNDFARLFMVPGMNHCAGGPGATEFDYLAALEAWVEKGEAPAMLVGRRTEGGVTVAERAVLPYPRQNRYRQGDPARAASYVETPGRPGAAKP